jgi:hypothetical protein
MVLVRQTVRNVYRYVLDRQYSSGDKYVLQRNPAFIFLTLKSGEQPRDRDPLRVLQDTRIVVPRSDQTLPLRVPDLTSAPNTIYTRESLVEGSDYEILSSTEYDWRLARAWYQRDAEFNDVQFTWYLVMGRWNKYQGVSYNISRS